MNNSDLKVILESLIDLRGRAVGVLNFCEGNYRSGYLRGIQDVIRLFLPSTIDMVPKELHDFWHEVREEEKRGRKYTHYYQFIICLAEDDKAEAGYVINDPIFNEIIPVGKYSMPSYVKDENVLLHISPGQGDSEDNWYFTGYLLWNNNQAEVNKIIKAAAAQMYLFSDDPIGFNLESLGRTEDDSYRYALSSRNYLLSNFSF